MCQDQKQILGGPKAENLSWISPHEKKKNGGGEIFGEQ